MLEIMVVMAILGLVTLLSWVNWGAWVRRMRGGASTQATRSIISAAQENAVLTGHPIRLKTEKRELTFYPDGRIEEKRDEE